ncbi:MAG: Anion transporter family protein [Thermotoga sp. 50_1627]|nr:MAG: Anion transporter family protein [Thermotoga sp. 50_1627]
MQAKAHSKKAVLGVVLAIIVFVLVITLVPTTKDGLKPQGRAALAVFLFAFVLWVTEPFPPYVTAFVSIILLIITKAWDQKSVLGVFGYDVIWLMVCAFILNSAMENTNLGKRIALGLITKFGHTSRGILLALITANFALSFLIPSTTARAALVLPIALMLAQAYNATPGKSNFGKLLMLFNMQSNEISTSGILTATSANIMAAGFIEKAIGQKVYYSTWLAAAMPVAVAGMIVSYFIGVKLFPPEVKEANKKEVMEKLKEQYTSLGRIQKDEIRALVIFLITVFLWCTDRWHKSWFGMQLNPTLVAIIGATLVLLPKVGVIKKWSDVKIPWDLMLFSCGAYAVGMALDKSGAASFIIKSLLSKVDLTNTTLFKIYAIVMFIALYSHIIFTSKTVRITILGPMVISFAQQIAPILGLDPNKLVVALALPVGFTICWCITLPPQSKPNLIYYSTGFYSAKDQLIHGLLTVTVAYLLFLLAGPTWFKLVGIWV